MNRRISKKKVPFPVTPSLQRHLDANEQSIEIPVSSEDLLQFEDNAAILDRRDEDTLWVDCMYSSSARVH